MGTALYWGEGSKTDNSKLAFINSDPDMIVFMKRWLKEIAVVSDEDFMPRVFINEIHRARIHKVVGFWAQLLELPMEQFGKPIFLKTKLKKKYDNHDSYFGVLQLGVRKGTSLKYQILGLIDALKDQNKCRRSSGG